MIERQGIIVWLYSLKHAKSLRRFGNVIYTSKRLKYVVIYNNAEDHEKLVAKMENLNFVRKVDSSFKPMIKTEYENSKPDKAKEYDYKMGF
ncbi:YlbG family protein [Mangrovibacillus cuniculi]|uniref:DUF2129 domain-containing protein n=1 Tax=Mangrovibacillus cuniculi TaxID=2593652 RepID=A0A7S8CA69_9BACI|nr:DUF2129 domain-containing protein [Mangrovibacillus cuniculi]QPC46230.1 DUF2129 domain-containing protein [Mangrovibacillus cuniculi]